MRIRLIEGRPQGATSRERRSHAALAEGGVAVRTDLRRAGDFKPASGRLLANALLDLRRTPTALFICNHRMTVGVPAAIHQRGLRGPQDVARVGFDGRPSAEALDPPLAVVRPPAYEVGRQARELLLKRIMEPAPAPVPVRLRPALVACRSRWRLARQAADKRQNA